MPDKFILIGLDGGASKISGMIIDYCKKNFSFKPGSGSYEIAYKDLKGFNPNFTPIALKQQLIEKDTDRIQLSHEEIRQGEVYLEACFRVIHSLMEQSGIKKALIGIGMAGIKTGDKKGIAVSANGPRIISFLNELEKKLKAAGIKLIKSIPYLGSDADFCGIGEEYADNGSFKNINNGYYLGGGTGTADAIKLLGNLIPFDRIKKWLAKTWEMKNDLGISLENYGSAAGLTNIYTMKSKIPAEKLQKNNIFIPQIAQKALAGDQAAEETFQEAANYLALLLYERITTLYAGWQNLFQLINPKRPHLITNHEYKKELFDIIVIGQRLADFLKSREGKQVLMLPLVNKLTELIINSNCLDKKIKNHYLHAENLRTERIILSPLREAPALGAAIDAFLHWQNS